MTSTKVLIRPLEPSFAYGLGGVLAKAIAHKRVTEILDETYGEEGVDWVIDFDGFSGIYVDFACPKQALRFKLTWNP